MTAVFSIVICEITYNDGQKKTEIIKYGEYSVLMASVDIFSVIKHLQSTRENVKTVEVKDILYFKSKQDYDNYSI